MRHVILGSNTVIGNSIIRVLGALGNQKIIACSPTGELPEGISRNQVTAIKADILDPYSLIEILQENDIVYNTQINHYEMDEVSDSDLLHSGGLINLLGISTHVKVSKVVTYLPQTMGWDIPINADETSKQKKHSPYHKTLVDALKIAEKYWAMKEYGWQKENIQHLMTQEPSDEGEEEKDEVQKSPEDQTKPTLSGPQSPSSDPKIPKLDNNDNLSESSGPKMPKLSINTENDTDESIAETINPNNQPTKDSTEPDATEQSILQDNEEEEVEILRIPLVVARFARFFGPFEEQYTAEFCKQIRLQRMTVVGKLENEITWINPLDAARAMIILGDKKIDVNPEQYMINGFIASPMKILKTLDKINYSSIDISHKSLFWENIKFRFGKLFQKLGIDLEEEYLKFKPLNTTQIFDDSKAREEWGWDPKYDLEKTSKEAMNWFVNHVL